MSITDEPFAGNYDHHGTTLTCALFEGSITIPTTATYSPSLLDARALVQYGNPASKGDFIELTQYAGCTMTATGGLPVVAKADANGEFVIGRLVSEPTQLMAIPSSSYTINSSATLLTAFGTYKYFRTAAVELFCSGVFQVKATSAASVNITAGDAVQPSAAVITSDGWIFGTDCILGLSETQGAMWATNNTGTSNTAAFIALTSAIVGTEYILVAWGVHPALMVA